jgi:asparagine synthase (glutamine-hydrolysing)
MSDVSIHLDDREWVSRDGTAVRGAAFRDGAVLDAAGLVDLVSSTESLEAFRAAIRSLNGYFAVIHRVEDAVYAAVDRHQTTPLYYGWADGERHVGADARAIREALGERSREPLAETEFLLTGYVTGGETLYPDLRQVQAGELVAVGDDHDPATADRYYRYQPTGDAEAGEDALLERLDQALVNAFERLIAYADGRTIVVPLSGGYDSRLVVLMLDRLGYDDLIAFSYGKSWDPETTVSRRIAREIGIQWESVEYTTDRWHDWFHSPERERYYEETFGYGALPGWTNLAWPAVWELRRQGTIPDDAVFAPGHTAVSPSEHFPDGVRDGGRVGQERVARFLKNANYKLWDWDDDALDDVLEERVLREVATDSFARPADAARATAEWYWQERHAKFIAADCEVYDFWDYDWWLPLWDTELTECWQSIPLEHREDKQLYRTYVDRSYADHTGVEIEDASETEMTSPIRRLHHWLYHSPVFDLVRPLYALARYDGDPRGWPGVMSRRQFASLFTGRQRAYSFFALQILDRLSFDPPVTGDVPSDGELSVDVSEFDTTAARSDDPSQPVRTSAALGHSP